MVATYLITYVKILLSNLLTSCKILASEATYELYYKLKKKYEVENSSKSEALVRVDQVSIYLWLNCTKPV